MAVLWGLIVLILLPAGIFSAVYGVMAIVALPLAVVLAFLLPRRWLRGMPALTLFFGSMLLAPVLMMAGLALTAWWKSRSPGTTSNGAASSTNACPAPPGATSSPSAPAAVRT
jgi:hypothetical protein